MFSPLLLSMNLLVASGEPANLHQCMRDAWMSTHPTTEQNQAARQILMGAHDAVKDQVPALREAMRGIHSAYAKHPIVKVEVVAAETQLKTIGEPVHAVVRDARIDVINLLSNEQRNSFNQSLKNCLKHD